MFGPFDFTTWLIAALIFIPLERISPLRADQKLFRKHWRNDLVNLIGNGLIIPLCLLGIISALMVAIRFAVPSGLGVTVRSQPVWLQILEILLVSDIGFYLAHRAFHAIPVLWKIHSVHHSSEALDWLAAYRVHPLDQIATKAVSYLPVYALGFSDPAILAFAFVYKWQSVFIHSNCLVDFGPLRWIFSSPHFHHWHHANEPEAIDRNFAGQLPFLDLIGGTAYMPKRAPAAYGTHDPVPLLYHQQLAYPFRATRLTESSRDAPA